MWFLEFASPWMAPWLAAAAIPIAIHFLHRRKQQTLSWAAIELLLHIVQKQSRRMQFEQWLLLLLRTAVLVLFALAIMRPWRHLPTSSNSAESEAASAQLHIIVLDASYSMLAKETESSRWESAVRAAVRIIRERNLGDAVQLIRMAQRAESVNGEPSFEHERMILETERQECSAGTGDLTGALDLIDRTVRTARSTAAWPQSIHVHFLTDLENETWRTWSDQPFLQRWKAMTESVDEVHVESFASTTGGNVGIVELKTDQRAALPGRPLRVTALIQNNTPKPIQLPIQFQTGGNTIRSETVSAAAGETAAVSVELIPPDAPFWALTAEIPADRLPIDDRRHLVIPVRRQIRVACVEDEKNSAQMAALALAPGTSSGSSGNRRDPFAVETLAQFELNGSRLVNSDAVVLCNTRKLTAKQIETLTAFAARGGAIIALLNRDCDAIDWNREEQGAAELFGFKLIRPSEDADYALDPLQYRSPIAAPFEAYPESGLLTTPIFRYWKIEPNSDIELVTDLALSSGEPWIVRRTSNSHRTLAMLSGPERPTESGEPWNAVGTWPSFVPLLQQMVQSTVAGSGDSVNLIVGDVARGKADGLKSIPVRMSTPQGNDVVFSTTAAAEGGEQSWSYAQTDQVGIVQIFVDDQPARPYAINIDPEQSRLAATPSLQLAKLQSHRRSTNLPSATTVNDPSQRDGTVRLLLLLLLCGLVSESVLAWSMGRRFA